MTDVSGNFIFDCLVGDCAPTGGGGGVTDLSALDDTLISSPTTGQSLNWNGTYWVNSTPTTGVTDHGLLGGLLDNDHPQYTLSATNLALSSLVGNIETSTIDISGYIASNETAWSTDNDTTDHTLLTNIGTKTHAEIDTHIADGSIHFTEGSIDHGSIAGLGDNDHPQYVLVTTNTALSSLVTSVETSTIDLSSYIAANEAAWLADADVSSLSGLGDTDINNINAIEPTQHLTWDGTQWINDFNDITFLRVYNDTGVDIAKGKCVYITGAHNQNVATVALARSDSQATMPSIGITYDLITAGTEGLVVSYGRANGVIAPSPTFTEGNKVYVSPTTAGEFTETRPTAGNHLVQNIGVVMRTHATNGTIKVTGIGRSNDIPNGVITANHTDVDYVYVDDGDVYKKITLDNMVSGLITGPYPEDGVAFWDGAEFKVGSVAGGGPATNGHYLRWNAGEPQWQAQPANIVQIPAGITDGQSLTYDSGSGEMVAANVPYISFAQFKPSTVDNINQASKSYISWDTADVTGGAYSSDYVLIPASDQIAFYNTGVYEISVNLGVEAGGTGTANQRTNQIVRCELNGTDVGPTAKTGYIRITSGHTETSYNIATFLLNISAAQRLKVGSTRESNQVGVVNTIPDECFITIRRIS